VRKNVEEGIMMGVFMLVYLFFGISLVLMTPELFQSIKEEWLSIFQDVFIFIVFSLLSPIIYLAAKFYDLHHYLYSKIEGENDG